MQNRAVMLDFVPQFHVMTCNMFETYSTLQRLFMNLLSEVIYSLHVHYISTCKTGIRDFPNILILLTHLIHLTVRPLLKMTVFWDLAPCSLVEINRRFRDAYGTFQRCLLPLSSGLSRSQKTVIFLLASVRT
jgi:hypothetical protein